MQSRYRYDTIRYDNGIDKKRVGKGCLQQRGRFVRSSGVWMVVRDVQAVLPSSLRGGLAMRVMYWPLLLCRALFVYLLFVLLVDLLLAAAHTTCSPVLTRTKCTVRQTLSSPIKIFDGIRIYWHSEMKNRILYVNYRSIKQRIEYEYSK